MLGESTSTQFDGGNGFHENVSTIEAVEDGEFKTVWYERQSRGAGEKHVWGSDLCNDSNGNPLGYEPGQACGPLRAQAMDGEIGDECVQLGALQGKIYYGVCMAGSLIAAGQVAAGGTAVVLASGGLAAPPVVALGSGALGLVAGYALCDHAQAVGEAIGQLACDAISEAVADPAPGAVAIALDPGLPTVDDDGCDDVNGTSFEGEAGTVNSGGCSGVESATGSALTVQADDATYEITVYGSSSECSSATVTANDDMCVVYSG